MFFFSIALFATRLGLRPEPERAAENVGRVGQHSREARQSLQDLAVWGATPQRH